MIGQCLGSVCSGLENKAANLPRRYLIPAFIRACIFLKNFNNMLIFFVNWQEVIWFAESNAEKGDKMPVFDILINKM